MPSPLWKREMRGAQRQWLRRPWVVPLGILAAAVIQGALFPEIALPTGAPTVLSGLATLWPQVALAVWIVYVVTGAIARDRLMGTDEVLAVTLIDPRSVVLAKTFGPSLGAMAALGLLRLMYVFLEEDRLQPVMGGQAEVAIRVFGAGLLPLAVLVNGVLIPLAWATLASRVATGVRQPAVAGVLSFIVGSGFLLCLLCLGPLGVLVPPLCIVFLTLWGLVLLKSHAISISVAVALCFAALNVMAEGASVFSVGIMLFLGAWAVTFVITLGLDSALGLLSMGFLAFWFGFELTHRHLLSTTLRGQYTDMLLLCALAPWLLMWWRWTRHRFGRSYFARQ